MRLIAFILLIASLPAMASVWMGPISSQPSDSGAYVYVQGEIRNDNAFTIRWVKAVVIGRDASGNLVETDTSYCEPSTLAPGSTATYSVMMRYDSRVTTWDVRIRGEQ